MARYFVIFGEPLEPNHEQAFAAKIEGFGFWHWFGQGWLITDANDVQTTTGLSSMLQSLDATKQHIVIQVNPITWAFAMRASEDQRQKAATWFETNWPMRGRIGS